MKVYLAALALFLAAPLVLAQQPAFEVASIKRNTSGTLNSGMNNQPGGRVTVINMTLRQLVRGIHRLGDYPLFTALQEQLGLKLVAERGPVDVLVIDSAKRPMED